MTPPTLETIYDTLSRAGAVEEVFGPLPADPGLAAQAVRAVYRRLAQAVHPDRNPRQAALAEAAFRLLEQWRARAEAAAAGPAGDGMEGLVLRTRRNAYTIQGAIGPGDYFVRYRCTTAAGEPCVLKLTTDAANNDLAAQEAETLRDLAEDAAVARYLPRVIETFLTEDGAQRRRATVFAANGAAHSIEAIRGQAPGGIDPRDAAWMFNRLLEALALAHGRGVVHGAVLPPNAWPVIDTHGLELGEWAYSVRVGEPLRAMSSAYEAWYPPEVLAGRPATAATDLYLAARTLLYLLGANPLAAAAPAEVPAPIGRVFQACLLASPHRRPQSAAALRDHFRDVLRVLYGPPKFRVFSMPAA
jgi:hypothetical protein